MADLGRTLSYIRPYWRSMLGALLSLLLVTVANLVNPQLLRLVVDQGISARNLTAILYASLALLGVAVLRGLFTFTQGYLSEKASQGAAFDLRNQIFSQIENLSFSYHDKVQTGQLMTRVTNDVDQIRNFTGNSLLQLLNAIVLLLGSAVILFLTNWQLALVALSIVPVILVIFFFFFRTVAPLFRVVQQKLGELNTVLQENLAGVRVVKAFGREPYELERYNTANNALLKQNLTVVRGTTLTFPLIFLVSNLGTLAVIWFGGNQVIDRTLSVGELVAFNSYLGFLLTPVFILGNTATLLSQAGASAKRVFEVLDTPVEIKDKPEAFVLPPLQGRVTFDNVSFRYAGSETASLEHLSFEAAPGQTIAILGRTGSGKSSVINLIPRFYDVSEGQVLVDGHDVRDVTLASLRSQIGIVLQEATLFSGTIRENIAYGQPEATQTQIETVARAAQAHDFITHLPLGYDTVVGERGVGLSGGQKQRIAIARALLLDPPLLILDDSTSAVDAETEYQLQQALARLKERCTTFIIAQRLSTVRNADWILFLERGKLVAQGTHQQLIVNNSLYCEVCEDELIRDADDLEAVA